MIARILSSAVLGLDAYLVDVEVDVARGLPMFTIVGLPDAAVKESKDRVRAAIKNTGFNFPGRKITINLAPADIKKEGSKTLDGACHFLGCNLLFLKKQGQLGWSPRRQKPGPQARNHG